MQARQRDRVTLQLFDAEQLRAQQLGILAAAQRISCACRKSEFFDGYDMLLARTWGDRAILADLYLPKAQPRCLRAISLYRLFDPNYF
ncbi:MAG: hypothetical protein Q8N48_02805 [Thiobacillus sp.]|nr:hypothetical protein [Thiobacillus sp.]MDP2977740.1 hypothetical protein [Thiobacillus sp.]